MKRVQIVAYTLLYYVTSISLGFVSSYFLSEHSHNFRYPLFIAGCQNMVHFIMATLCLMSKGTNPKKINIRSIPCALSAAVDIGVSSYSLRHIPLAFYTMVKSSAPVFILLCGFAFGIETPSIFLFLLMFTIGGGVFLTSFVDTKFDVEGFGIVSIASFMAGFRWAFVQYLIHKHRMRNTNVIMTIQELCFSISILLLVSSCVLEGISTIFKCEFLGTRTSFNVLYILLSGILSFVLILSEFVLVELTSVIYLSMSGIVKELIIVIYSTLRKDIRLNGTNIVGLCISIVGIVLFNLSRKKKREEVDSG